MLLTTLSKKIKKFLYYKIFVVIRVSLFNHFTMAQYNFEGDIDDVSERQLQFINQVLLEHGYENSKVTFTPVGKAGDNYVANVKRITIEGENGNITMVAKFAPPNNASREIKNSGMVFKNEHIMYFDVLPKLVQLQKDEGIPEEEQLKYAKCYGSLAEEPNEVIIFEDLNTLNFTILDRFVSLTDEAIKSVLKNFAILHSLSYVLKQKEPQIFEEFKSSLTDLWVSVADSPGMKIFCQILEDQALSILQVPDHINIVKNKLKTFMTAMAKVQNIDKDNKYGVILQGDAWTNNIMFKFEDGNIKESLMIDYQLSRISSPVSDIMYLIFNCTDYGTRRNHFNDWIDYYHAELEKSLANFGLKANFVYPRDKLDADLKRYGKPLFGLSVMLSNMLIRKTEDAAKMREMMDNVTVENMTENVQEMGVSGLDQESIDLYKTRVTGLIESFTEFGLL